MLYLPWSQINVPRDRHLGNSSHLKCCRRRVEYIEPKGEYLKTLKTAQAILEMRKGAGCAFSVFVPGALRISTVLAAW
jgi:hypothetical protein